MFQIFAILAVLLLPLCQCFYVEISLTDKNESKSVKLVCGPPTDNLNLKSNNTILWHGSQFDSDEQQKLSEVLQSDVFVPNISINSSKRHRCYLLADESSLKSPDSLTLQKKRVSRESLASIPVENGVCPPGHRIDQDRCFACFPGSYTSGQDTECFLCPKDFYMDKAAADSCWPCPMGKKTLAQGADSEESCIFFDDTGHAVITQSPPWIAIYSLIGVIIACVWIAIIILVVRYWKEWKKVAVEQVERAETGGLLADRRGLSTSRKEEGGAYESSPSTDAEDHTYTEISDTDADAYEGPRKPAEPPILLDLSAPTVPPKKHKKPTLEDQYEIPIKKSSGEQYEVPIRKSSEDDHLYEVPINKSSDNEYEIPIKKNKDNQDEVTSKKSSDDPKNHDYEEIKDIPNDQRAPKIKDN